MTEDPVRFDVYGVVASIGGDDAKRWCAVEQAQKKRDWLIAVNASVTQRKAIVVMRSVGYSKAMSAREELTFLADVLVCQEGYGPEDVKAGIVQFCDEHRVYSGGIFGCHVCRGFYVE